MSAEIPVNKILFGPCEEELKKLPDACIDAFVTDPPYGLGTREPTAKDIEHYLKGESLDTGGDFMGKPWEIPTVPIWKECYRVLKPGGYVLSFAGTRTWDIMSVGLRAAGFDNRDTISREFSSPCLQWLHGQGFPKSLNIAKKLRDAGASEEVIKQWEGFGTALKPAWEPILCFRKPLAEATVHEQVVATGTGGINIGGTRIKHASPEDFEKHKEQVDRIKEKGGQWGDSWKNSSDLSGASEVTSAGRWPPNAVLEHSPECKVVGTRKVDAPVINRFDDGMKPFGEGAGHPYTSEQTGDENGEEEIPIYECADGCPVKALDEQSGERRSAGNYPTTYSNSGGFTRGDIGKNIQGPLYDDKGGASRFFAQFMPDAPFFYTGKASKREKNEGVLEGKFKDGFVVVKEKLKDEETILLAAEWPADYPEPTTPIMEEAVPESIRKLFEKVKPDDNRHPTVKPVALMRWLVRLVTPKGGIVLDPYCGSGTTCAAAVLEEMRFIGIDKDPLFHKLAEKRVGHLYAKAEERRDQQDALSTFFE